MQSPEFATAALRILDEPMRVDLSDKLRHPISVDPDISGGQPVFTGTRVPTDTLLAYADAGKSIDEYFLDYDVARWKIDAVLALPRDEVHSLVRELRRKKAYSGRGSHPC